ncbi:DNA glycosylase [Lentinus tigrinus ALCF2SS1-7]|uniref:Endonuclease III homolog n=1 Tax=Lentinus tigrinus ALCF2SS1-6 TaxID=1328759 RepID=A0A5C2RXB2_9APHY|nr:DNA glycosylase [Lentinus tigrinus ALCF2SS1-6]RPD69097.1 DNA glycosylase [Lentinus tigrinus ALCF2SS1-7]
MKRNLSLRATPSPFSTKVTLYEATDAVESVRRSKRLKVSAEHCPEYPELSEVAEQSASSRKATERSDPGRTSVKTESVAGTPRDTLPGRPKPKRVTSPRTQKPIPTALETPHPAPPRWRETYDTIKRMRLHIVAPVDTMGCDQAQLREADPRNQRYSTLVSLMLSSQTKDEVTDAAVAKLREAVGGTLSVDAILQADESVIAEAICKVGFWRRKTQYIKQAAQKLRDEFDSDVPKTVDELCSLPGVGPKMAFLTLQVAWKLNAGIGVDVHVHRITNRLGWHKPPSKTPEETRLNLQSWLPLELHPEINHLLVGFGQTICTPVAPKCDQCELSDGLCPSARKVAKASSSKPGSKKVTIFASGPDTGAGPKIEVALEEEEHKIALESTSATRRTPPEQLKLVKIEGTSP